MSKSPFVTEAHRRAVELKERLYGAAATAPEVVVAGVVQPLGAFVGRTMGEPEETLQFDVIAWKVDGGALQRGSMCVFRRGGGSRKLVAESRAIEGCGVIRMRARVAMVTETGTPHAVMVERLRWAADQELDAISAELKRPVVIDHPTFGDLVLNRALEQFEGQVRWGGRTSIKGKVVVDGMIRVVVSGSTTEEANSRLRQLERVVDSAAKWDTWAESVVLPRIMQFIEGWNEEDRVEESEVREVMGLESIEITGQIGGDGQHELMLMYELGDVMGGHLAQVFASMSGVVRDIDYIG